MKAPPLTQRIRTKQGGHTTRAALLAMDSAGGSGTKKLLESENYHNTNAWLKVGIGTGIVVEKDASREVVRNGRR